MMEVKQKLLLKKGSWREYAEPRSNNMKMELAFPESFSKIAVLGGDTRQIVIADALAEAGYETAVFGIDCDRAATSATRCVALEDAVRGASMVVLPLPFSSDNVRINCPLGSCDVRLSDLFAMFQPGIIVSGGRFNDMAFRLAEQAGVTLYDYCNSEEVNILNAVPTAEGAIAVAMQHLPITLHGSRCTVVGFGRCGKALARDLAGLGAHVTVTARRREDLAWIDICGYQSAVTGETDGWRDADVIFNTVPHLLFDAAALDTLPSGVLLIDLASRPGGVDSEAAAQRDIRVLRALSLPGKAAPVTAGRILAAPLLRLLRGGTPDMIHNTAEGQRK